MTLPSCPNCGAELAPGFRFCGNCGREFERTPASAGERREVAVLFADMRGFTALSEKLDPEHVHTLMNECFGGLGRAIQAEGGHIDKYIGDNVMAVFGAPLAHEDDPARACRAALAMQDFMSSFAEHARAMTGVEPRMRIGIHCGLVLAGGVGSDVRMDYSVMGDTVNLAARLESAATPGSVLVSRAVVRRTRGQFRFGPPGQLSVKGREQPVEAYELLGELIGPRLHSRGVLYVRFVDRESELRELMQRWDRFREGSRWIEVRGEIGIGKTRLVEEAAGRSGRPLVAVAGTANAQRRPLGLVRNLVLAVARELGGYEGEPETQPHFAAALARVGQDVAAFADVLWYLAAPAAAAVAPPDPDPQTLRRMVERGVATLLEGVARHSPGVMLLLDAYELADEASVALLGALARRLDGLPVPMLVTSRDDRPALRPQAVLRLGELQQRAMNELLDLLVRGADLPPEVRRDLMQRAAGVPLFLEEMIQTLVDEGLLNAAGEVWRWERAPTAVVSLPPSIRAAMVARLDRLERPLRELLCRCSVQGVEFDLRVTAAMQRLPPGQGPQVAELVPALERLGLITYATRGRSERCAFRQPLMQEACYETLLLRERQVLHGEVADALCALYGGAELVSPTLLAHHYEKAERWLPAADANLRAAAQAAELFLNEEALRRFARVLEMLERAGPLGEQAARLRARAHAGVARVHLRTGDYARVGGDARALRAVAVGAAERAEADRLEAAACVQTGRTAEGERFLRAAVAGAQQEPPAREALAEALYDLSELCLRAGRTGEALALLAECREAVGPQPGRLALRADMLEGRIAHAEGRFAHAASLYAHAYRQAEEAGSLSEQASAANNLGNAARDQGDYDAARQHFRRALELWERTGDAECIAGGHNNLGNVAMSRGDFAEAREHYERSLAVSREIGNVHGMALAQANLAILAIEEGDGRAAVGAADSALETLGESANELLRGLALVVSGEARLECGEVTAAQSAFERVLRDYDEGKHPLAVAGARRGLGRIALLRGRPDEALGLLDAASEAFERLERVQEAARTVLHRAQALRARGERDHALAELRRARERFLAIRAERDAERVERLLRELGPPA